MATLFMAFFLCVIGVGLWSCLFLNARGGLLPSAPITHFSYKFSSLAKESTRVLFSILNKLPNAISHLEANRNIVLIADLGIKLCRPLGILLSYPKFAPCSANNRKMKVIIRQPYFSTPLLIQLH